jgi:hypothetical protein
MRLTSDEDGVRTEEGGAWESARRINALPDRVRSSATGLSVEEVERLLKKERLSEFGSDIPQEPSQQVLVELVPDGTGAWA